MSERRVAIIAGRRTPFVKAGKTFKDMGPLKLACYTVKGMIERHEVDPAAVEALAYGVVVPEPGRPNLAREIVFEAGLPMSIEAQTISSYCITGLRTITVIADAIARDRIEVGVAGGVDSLSFQPHIARRVHGRGGLLLVRWARDLRQHVSPPRGSISRSSP